MKTLFIVDASGYIYRSYFAIRNITNAKGESTNALFGFIRSLLKLRKDFNPKHLVAIFDGPRSIEKRKEVYQQYKAQRAATPQDLGYQIEWSRKACELMGIPYLSITGVEADDTMGSVALWAEKQGYKVFLCTSDKDLCQLVNDNISILNTFKENLILGPKEVEENFGVPPNRIVDLLSMTGDTSDNIPGIPGIGPKTAASLLQQYGSLDNIIKNIDVLEGKKKDLFTQHKDNALLSRQLVTLHPDIHFPKEQTFYELREPNFQALKDFYTSMNFSSLIRELEQTPKTEENSVALKTDSQTPEDYLLVDSEKSLHELVYLLKTKKTISISTLGTHTQPIQSDLVGIAFGIGNGQSYYIPANGILGREFVLKTLKPILEEPNLSWIGHNIKYDYQLLYNYGIKIAHCSFDTMLASYILNSHQRQHNLDQLVLDRFGIVLKPITDLLGKGKKSVSILNILTDQVYSFPCRNADYIYRLKEILEKELESRKLLNLMKDLELQLTPVLAKMERHGIYIDLPYLKKMSQTIQHQIALLAKEIYEFAGEEFNLNSPKQLSEILFTKLKIPAPKKTATGLSTNVDVLEFLSSKYPIAGRIMEYRTLEKLRSTYIEALPFEVNEKTGRIHCTFNQSVAATGRLSCQNPNLQNIPIRTEIGKKIRTAFRPEKDNWSYLAADYSQIELRLLAHFSRDPHLIEAFQTGKDVHAHTASIIFNIPLAEVTREQRYNAKAVNFGVIYGQQAFGLSQELGIELRDAAAFINAYFKQYSKVKEFIEECKEKARQTGKAVTSIGRERLIPEIHSKNAQIRSLAERLAVNTPLQGTAADMIKMAMLQIDKKLQHGYMILQIHDELIFEVPDHAIEETAVLVKETMENVMNLCIPLVVDVEVGKNWAEC